MKRRLTLLVIIQWVVMVCMMLAEIGKASNQPLRMKDATHQKQIVAAAMAVTKNEYHWVASAQQAFRDYTVQKKMAERIQEVTRPEILIPAFMRHLQRGTTPSPAMPFSLAKAMGGSITGKVTVAGANPDPNYPITVVAFDSLGYYAAQSEDASVSATYTISGLKSGKYYVMTFSNYYVDEIYHKVAAPLNDCTAWRSATKVVVQEGQTTSGIDFDLQTGAKISGRIFHAGGSVPIQEQQVTFIFTKKESSTPVYEKSVYIFSGNYEITVPLTGECKMAVKADEYTKTYYGNTADWNAAATLMIADYHSVINNINITLIPDPQAAMCGSIAGAIRYSDRTDVPFFSAFYAFKIEADDTVFSQLTIGIFGTYTFESLLQGEYIIYGNDILGDLLGGYNYLGQYYQNATTPQQAKPVKVVAGQMTEGINFVLQQGGSISGRVTNAHGMPIDSILVMAFKADYNEQGQGDLFPASLALYLCGTDANGSYQLTGLPSASYIVRTISDSLFDINQLGFSLQFKKHGGKYVDEYYGDVQNIFAFQNATTVPVKAPQMTEHIDFVLEDAKYFTGTVTDAVSGAPVTNIMLFALNDTSAQPFFALQMLLKKQVKETGEFRLGPLPSGKYKILAVAGGLQFKTDYLSEFYDGVRDFSAATTLSLGQTHQGGIHFTLDRGAVIQGFINLPQNGGTVRTGADVLDGFPVLVYHAETGELASLDFVQFAGGYRVDHLLPGNYKVLALPTVAPYAATYYGGGNSFTDPASQTVSLTRFGEIKDCPITLETAQGCIAGKVMTNTPTPQGLSQIMVIAYDASGHPCGLALSDMNLHNGWVNPQPEGAYLIEGLRSGQYYLRTFSLSAAFGLSQQVLGLVNMFTGDFDVLGLLANLNDITSLFNLNLSIYQDRWYQDLPAVMDLDLISLVFHMSAYGIANPHDAALLPIYLPLPMAEKIPKSAVAVTVTDGQKTEGKDFILPLGELGTAFSGVDMAEETLPQEFIVYPNYPNPFNPSTLIMFDLPNGALVRVVVFNLSGQQVAMPLHQHLPPGSHHIRWYGLDDLGRPVPPGIYFAQVTANHLRQTIKMTLVK